MNSFQNGYTIDGTPRIIVDEKAWAVITVFVLGVVAVRDLLGGLPAGVILTVGIFAAVLPLGIGILVLGEIRDGARDGR